MRTRSGLRIQAGNPEGYDSESDNDSDLTSPESPVFYSPAVGQAGAGPSGLVGVVPGATCQGSLHCPSSRLVLRNVLYYARHVV
jgi:hypothetical protein